MNSCRSHSDVYGCWGTHLGDAWAFANYCLTNKLQKITTAVGREGSIRDKLLEIIPLLDTREVLGIPTPNISMLPPDEVVNQHDAWSTRYLPTYTKWLGDKNIVAYQFDGQSNDKLKNPPDVSKILAGLEAQGLEPVRLGDHINLTRCVNIAAHAKFFIGCDSGMSHLCHSVGVPTILVEHEFDFSPYHIAHDHICAKGVEGALEAISLVPIIPTGSHQTGAARA